MTIHHLTTTLSTWTRRRRLRDALIWVPRGLLVGLLVAVMLAVWARFRPLLTNSELGWAALALALTATAVTTVILLLQRYPLPEQARFADRQFALQQRTTTAVELHTGTITTTPELAQQQLNDTLAATAVVDLNRALPYELKRQDWLLILLAIALLLAAIYLDNPQIPALLQQRAVATAVAEQTDALEQIADDIRQNDALTDEQQAQLLEPVEQTIQDLQANDLSQETAVAMLSEAEADLRDLEASLTNEALQQALDAAGDPLAQHQASQSLGEALQNGDLAQAGSAAAELADNLDTLDAAAQQQLAEDLAQTAEALAQTDSELSQQLADAADALENGDVDAAQDALQDAGATLQERNQEIARNAQAAQQAADAANQANQSRSAVAQAGDSQPGEQGQQTQAGGEQASGQQGQSGSTGQQGSQGSSPGGQSGSETTGGGPAVGGPSQGGGSTENVFVPDFVDLSGIEGTDIELDVNCQGAGADCGDLQNETPTEFTDEGGSVVPYNQVFGDYRGAVNEALSGSNIPLGYKSFIRDYFSSLEPVE